MKMLYLSYSLLALVVQVASGQEALAFANALPAEDCVACTWPHTLNRVVANNGVAFDRGDEQIVSALLEEVLPTVANGTAATCQVVSGCQGSPYPVTFAYDPARSDAENNIICSTCEAIMGQVLSALQDPQTAQVVTEAGHAVCNRLLPTLRQDCLDYVDKGSTQFFELVNDLDAPRACQMTGACERIGLPNWQAVPAALHRVHAATEGLERLKAKAPSNETCEMCKVMVTEISTIIRDPKTQLEILGYVKQVCQYLTVLHSECVTYVDLYGPIIFNVIEQYLQPGPVCARLEFCPAATSSFLTASSRSGFAA